MPCVARRVSDHAMLHRIKMWLETVEKSHQRGTKQRTARHKDQATACKGLGSVQTTPFSAWTGTRRTQGWNRLKVPARFCLNFSRVITDFA